jgi:hypothetical protein
LYPAIKDKLVCLPEGFGAIRKKVTMDSLYE